MRTAREKWKLSRSNLEHRVSCLYQYVKGLEDMKGIFRRTEELNRILEDFPTLEQFTEVDQQQRDLEETARKLLERKKKLGLDEPI